MKPTAGLKRVDHPFAILGHFLRCHFGRRFEGGAGHVLKDHIDALGAGPRAFGLTAFILIIGNQPQRAREFFCDARMSRVLSAEDANVSTSVTSLVA